MAEADESYSSRGAQASRGGMGALISACMRLHNFCAEELVESREREAVAQLEIPVCQTCNVIAPRELRVKAHLGTLRTLPGAVAGGKMIECSHKASTPMSNCSMEKLLLKGSCHVCNTRKTTCARDAA